MWSFSLPSYYKLHKGKKFCLYHPMMYTLSKKKRHSVVDRHLNKKVNIYIKLFLEFSNKSEDRRPLYIL